MKLNVPLVKSMLAAAFVGYAVNAAETRIAPHQIGRTQTALRWVTIVSGVIATEFACTALEKHFKLNHTNGKVSDLFTR